MPDKRPDETVMWEGSDASELLPGSSMPPRTIDAPSSSASVLGLGPDPADGAGGATRAGPGNTHPDTDPEKGPRAATGSWPRPESDIPPDGAPSDRPAPEAGEGVHPLDPTAAKPPTAQPPALSTRLIDFDSAQLGALAHLYRGEVYRSTVWRTRLDNTTNWSIVMMGVALTSTFSSPAASALPLLVVGLLLLVFLVFEARRYRYFNVWRARARWIETHFYAPMLRGQQIDTGWRDVLAQDYDTPTHHISFLQALGRRLRRNFIWILAIQTGAYWGKLAIHPFPAQDVYDLIGRAAIGPVPGVAVLIAGIIYNLAWVAVAVWSWRVDRAKWGPDGGSGGMG